MKKLLMIIALMIIGSFVSSTFGTCIAMGEAAPQKVLVAYFSRSGNTRTVAKMIQSKIGGDLFEIKGTNEYPKDFKGVVAKAREEKRINSRPALVQKVENFTDYDTIFIGYPCWCGSMPMACYSFIEGYDFAGKTVIPFVTHGGTGFGDGISVMKNKMPGAIILKGLEVYGKESHQAQNLVNAWIDDLKL